MSNQTRGVSARIFFPTFHVCSGLFLPPKSAKLDWYASSQKESCMPYLSDRPTVCKLLAPQDRGLVCGRYSGYYTTVDFACYGLHFKWGLVRDGTVQQLMPRVPLLCRPNKSFTTAKNRVTEVCQWYYTEQVAQWFTCTYCIKRKCTCRDTQICKHRHVGTHHPHSDIKLLNYTTVLLSLCGHSLTQCILKPLSLILTITTERLTAILTLTLTLT